MAQKLLEGGGTPGERERQGKGRVTHSPPPLNGNILHSELTHVLIKTIFPENL